MSPSFLFRLGPSHWFTKFCGKALLAARGVLGIMWKLMPGLLPFNSMYLLPHAQTLKLITGLPMTTGKFMQIGERGYNLERMYNYREGMTAKDDALPERLTKTPQDSDNPDTVVKLKQMLPRYYQVRGWGKDGYPAKRKRKQLKLYD